MARQKYHGREFLGRIKLVRKRDGERARGTEGEGVGGQNISFKGTPLIIYFFQQGPT
jgi:hypothetical protein